MVSERVVSHLRVFGTPFAAGKFKSAAYLAVVILAGFALLASQIWHLRPVDPFRFLAFLTLSMLASSMKVSFPRVTGTLSVLFVFLLIGIIDLSLPETLLMGVAAAFVQSFWLAKKPRKLVHVSFNIANHAISIVAAYSAYTAPVLLRFGVPPLWRLIAAASVFFVANSLIFVMIIVLTEAKPFLQTWISDCFWSFPYYMIGACIAGLFSYTTSRIGWQTSILTLPVIYLIYRSYRLYLDRLEESRLHGQDLRDAATRLNSVLESTTDSVFAISPNGKITYANQRARSRLFGDSDPVGTDLWARFPKLAKSVFRDQVSRALVEKTPIDAEEFFADLNAWFEVRANTSEEGLALYLKEVTERRELSERLRQAQKMEAIGRLAGGVAHDFNNLLTVILGYSQMVVDQLGAQHPAASTMTAVVQAGERAAALTRQLLAFSRKQILQPEVLNLNDIVSGLQGMLRRLIGEDIRISVTLDPKIGKVRADRNQIEMILVNLSVNARDAMPNGGELRIATHNGVVDENNAAAHRAGPHSHAVLSVTDTGHGMDAETKGKIFEPFFTTKELGKGMGLGLSSVYGIVQQSGGFVTVQSEVGRGSTFFVHLPCVADSAKPVETFHGEGRHHGSGKILLVEDETALRELAGRMLTEAGYVVASTGDGGEALRLSRTELESIDLLITDMVMPGMSGPDLAAHLLKRLPKVEVLYISGYADHPLIEAGALSDRETLLRKPFTHDQLLMTVQKIRGGGADRRLTA